MDSGEPSKPERLARITTGRLLLAALMARAAFFEDRGKSVPAVQWSGPSAGTKPNRGTGFDSMPIMQTGIAAEMGVPNYRRFRPNAYPPSLQRFMVLVGNREHNLANIERPLASGVGLVGEDFADVREAFSVVAREDSR